MATVDFPETTVNVEPVVPEEWLYEVIDGKVVEKSNMGAFQTEFATILATYLAPYARQNGCGRVVVEAIVRIDEKTQYRPDIAFVSFESWPRRRRTPDKDPWEIIPDLAIEVVSKSNKAVEVLAKVRHYFEAGVRGVWLVYPTLEVFHIYESFDQIRVLTRDGILDGGNFITGFQRSATECNSCVILSRSDGPSCRRRIGPVVTGRLARSKTIIFRSQLMHHRQDGAVPPRAV